MPAPKPFMTDAALLAHLGERITARRLERDLTQAELAREAGVSTRTLTRLEAGESSQLTNFVRILRALELTEALLELIPEPMASPIEQLRAEQRKRRRASGRRRRGDAGPADDTWTWDDEVDA